MSELFDNDEADVLRRHLRAYGWEEERTKFLNAELTMWTSPDGRRMNEENAFAVMRTILARKERMENEEAERHEG